jgi:integrase
VKVVYTYLVAVMRSAVDDRLIAASPCSRISLPEVVRDRVIPLTTVQVGKVVEQAPARFRAMAVLDAATGPRSGELRGLTVDRLSPALHVRRARVPEVLTLHVDRQLVRVVRVGRRCGGRRRRPRRTGR